MLDEMAMQLNQEKSDHKEALSDLKLQHEKEASVHGSAAFNGFSPSVFFFVWFLYMSVEFLCFELSLICFHLFLFVWFLVFKMCKNKEKPNIFIRFSESLLLLSLLCIP